MAKGGDSVTDDAKKEKKRRESSDGGDPKTAATKSEEDDGFLPGTVPGSKVTSTSVEVKKENTAVEEKTVDKREKVEEEEVVIPEVPPKPEITPCDVYFHPMVAANEDEVKEQIEVYKLKANGDMLKAIGVTEWQFLNEEFLKDSNKPTAKERPLQWCWISLTQPYRKDSATVVDVSNADGLIVFRILKLTLVKSVLIQHFSLIDEDWKPKFAPVLNEATRIFFSKLTIGNIRITLNYFDQVGDVYAPNKAIEAVIKKELLFRWFQLTNSSDGRRGQVMNLRRAEDLPVPDCDEDFFLKPSKLRLCPADVETEEEEEG